MCAVVVRLTSLWVHGMGDYVLNQGTCVYGGVSRTVSLNCAHGRRICVHLTIPLVMPSARAELKDSGLQRSRQLLENCPHSCRLKKQKRFQIKPFISALAVHEMGWEVNLRLFLLFSDFLEAPCSFTAAEGLQLAVASVLTILK